MKTQNNTTEQLLSRRQLQTRWGCCIMTIKRRQQSGQLRPIYLSARMVRYSLQNVLHVEAEAAGSNTLLSINSLQGYPQPALAPTDSATTVSTMPCRKRTRFQAKDTGV